MQAYARTVSRRVSLQRVLGGRGVVHPRIKRGTIRDPAPGWYMTVDGQDVYLGDHSDLALVGIGRYLEQNPTAPEGALELQEQALLEWERDHPEERA